MKSVSFKRLERIEQYWYIHKEVIAERAGKKQAFVDDIDYVFEQAGQALKLEEKLNGDGVLTLEEQLIHAKEEIARLNQELHLRKWTSVSVDSIERFTNQIKGENKRLRKAINQALKKHEWNNEESARILEKALEVSK